MDHTRVLLNALNKQRGYRMVFIQALEIPSTITGKNNHLSEIHFQFDCIL